MPSSFRILQSVMWSQSNQPIFFFWQTKDMVALLRGLRAMEAILRTSKENIGMKGDMRRSKNNLRKPR